MRIKIDNREIEIDKGTILEVAERASIKIPTLCYLKGLFDEATCRVCVVELSNGKVVPACSFPVSDGLEVWTNTDRVRRLRRMALELLLSTHRIKCFSCKRKGGECKLLGLCVEYGVEGIPMCSECPLTEDECFIRRGIVCLGPLTIAGCEARCIREGYPCEGCRGIVNRKDVWDIGISFYKENGIALGSVLEKIKMFNYYGYNNYKNLVSYILSIKQKDDT